MSGLSPISPGNPALPRPLSSSLINYDGCLDRPQTKEGRPEGHTELCEDLRLWPSERAPAGEERKAKITIWTKDKGRGGGSGSRTSPKRNGVAAGPIPQSRRNKIGTNLIDLLYETKEDKMIRRICRYVVHSSSSLFSIFLKLGLFFHSNQEDCKPQRQTDP